jgi:homocysteine S-methyltransferase
MIKLKNIKYPLILDGGMSNVLEDQGCDLNHKLWSAKIIETNPRAIVNCHLTYLKAGANCITTAGYQATVKGFMELGFEFKAAKELVLRSVELAEKAKSEFLTNNSIKGNIYIAASMGPYGAYLADGSEYRGAYAISEKELESFHLEQIKILDASNADFLAFETIPSLLEIKILARLLTDTVKPSWVSFSCKDELYLNDGEKISKAAKILANHPSVFAIGVNCTAPKYITSIIQTLKNSAPDKRIIVYPNSGEVYRVDSKSWQGISDPNLFQKMAKEWFASGADILGGCCRIGPDHISKIKALL